MAAKIADVPLWVRKTEEYQKYLQKREQRHATPTLTLTLTLTVTLALTLTLTLTLALTLTRTKSHKDRQAAAEELSRVR